MLLYHFKIYSSSLTRSGYKPSPLDHVSLTRTLTPIPTKLGFDVEVVLPPVPRPFYRRSLVSIAFGLYRSQQYVNEISIPLIMQFFTLCLAIGALVASNLVEARTGFVMKHVPRASTNSTSTSISSSSSTMTGSKNCNSYFCVRTVLDSASSTLTYSLTTLGAPSGWYAVGTGSQMAGSTMWVVWAPSNGNGEIEWSERMATGNVEPNVVSTPSASYISTQSTTNSTGLEAIWTTSYSGSPDANYPLIWAVNPSDTPGAASGASINQHSVHGQMTMDLTTPVESNATVTDTSSSSGGGGRTYNTLIKIHIVCMVSTNNMFHP